MKRPLQNISRHHRLIPLNQGTGSTAISFGLVKRRAFTLIEVLVASLIMSLIAASLYMCIRLVLQSRDQCNRKTVAMRSVLLALDTITADFQGVMQPKTTTATTSSSGSITGRGSSSLSGQTNTTGYIVQAFTGAHDVF